MKKDKKILVLGGDERYLYAAEALSKKTFDCKIFGFGGEVNESRRTLLAKDLYTALKETDHLLLPIPYRNGDYINAPFSYENISLDGVLCALNKDAEIFCGKADQRIRSISNKVHDYSEREDFAILNAHLTAEAAVEIMLRELPISLKDAKTAILGYGRIGKALARLLHGFGNNFTVYARRDEIFAMLESCSYFYSDINTLEGLYRYDIVINTVPKTILFKEQLSSLKKTCVLLDLASLPGGTDKNAAAECGIKLIEARGLPGKCSPASAGRIICDCVNKIIYSGE